MIRIHLVPHDIHTLHTTHAGHRFQSESNLLDCTHPEKDGCAFALDRAHSEGDMLDSAPYENDAPRYTALLRRNDPIPDEYEDVSYGDNMQRW